MLKEVKIEIDLYEVLDEPGRGSGSSDEKPDLVVPRM